MENESPWSVDLVARCSTFADSGVSAALASGNLGSSESVSMAVTLAAGAIPLQILKGDEKERRGVMVEQTRALINGVK